MATVIQREATVQPDGKIEIRAPELPQGTRVRVSIEPEESQLEPKRRAADLLAEMPRQRLFKTAEEVEAYLKEERDSWDR